MQQLKPIDVILESGLFTNPDKMLFVIRQDPKGHLVFHLYVKCLLTSTVTHANGEIREALESVNQVVPPQRTALTSASEHL